MDLILPYTKVINSLFVQTLIWSKCTIGPQKLFRLVHLILIYYSNIIYIYYIECIKSF